MANGSDVPNPVRGETVKLTFVGTASGEKAVIRRQRALSGDGLLRQDFLPTLTSSFLPESRPEHSLMEGRGAHFDPHVVDAFMALQEDYKAVAARYAD